MTKTAKSFVIFILIIFTACDKKEVKREFYGNGKVKSEIEFINGIRNGTAKYYYENGKISEIQNYNNDTLSGYRIGFYENGNTRGKIYYNHGTITGDYKLFYNDGSIAESGEYKDGLRRGLIEQFYPGNKIQKRFYVIYFKDLKPHSCWSEEYDSLGIKISEVKSIHIGINKDSLALGETANVKFEMAKSGTYDSCLILVGEYDYLFNPIGKIDTIRLVNNQGNYLIEPKSKGKYYLRGKWLLYKNEMTKDSTYEYQTFNYFEESIKVY